MYSDSAIDVIKNRVGWYDAIPPNSTITLTPDAAMAIGGRYFNSFHQSATVENVFACIGNPSVSNDDLNAFLLKMKKDAAMLVMNLVFDTNILAQYAETQGVNSVNYLADYTDLVMAKQGLFDEAYGLGVCLAALQLFKITNRSNREQKISGMTYEGITIELDGVYAPTGQLVSKGISAKFNDAIKRLICVLFPTEVTGKATLRAVHYW